MQQQHLSKLQLGHSLGVGLTMHSEGRQPQSSHFISTDFCTRLIHITFLESVYVSKRKRGDLPGLFFLSSDNYFCTGHRKSSAPTRRVVTFPASSAAWTAASEVSR